MFPDKFLSPTPPLPGYFLSRPRDLPFQGTYLFPSRVLVFSSRVLSSSRVPRLLFRGTCCSKVLHFSLPGYLSSREETWPHRTPARPLSRLPSVESPRVLPARGR